MNSHYILLAVVFLAVAHAVIVSPVDLINQEAQQQLQQDQGIAGDQQLVRNKRSLICGLFRIPFVCKEPTYDFSGGDGAVGLFGRGGTGGNGGGNGAGYRELVPIERY